MLFTAALAVAFLHGGYQDLCSNSNPEYESTGHRCGQAYKDYRNACADCAAAHGGDMNGWPWRFS